VDQPADLVAAAGEETLTSLAALVEADLAACNRLIVARMDSPVALIPQLAAHIVAAGGKRLRPLLTLATSVLCGYGLDQGTRHILLAASVEFIHTATLLHDDVVDESLLRRGLASANAVFGNKASVLVGDFLFARAFQLMVEDGSVEVLKVLSRAAATVASGEVLQLMTQNDLMTSESRYLDVIGGKTASLFTAACEVGALVAERPPVARDLARSALADYGTSLGMAFQLVDDALDYAADERSLGKTVGDDFREGKVTLPVLIAYGAGGAEEREFWERTIGAGEQEDGDLEAALAAIERHRGIELTLERAKSYVSAAKKAMSVFPDTKLRRALANVAEYTVARLR
jgi:octaprenyl-diphosphate synthase